MTPQALDSGARAREHGNVVSVTVLTVAPVTSTIRDIPTEVVLTRDDGMPRTCAANLDHVQTVSRTKVGALIATLHADRMKQVADALRFALAV